MSVCCERCVLSGRGLCDELITRPEDSYRLWCVVCDIYKPREWGGPGPLGVVAPNKTERKKEMCYYCLSSFLSTWPLTKVIGNRTREAWSEVSVAAVNDVTARLYARMSFPRTLSIPSIIPMNKLSSPCNDARFPRRYITYEGWNFNSGNYLFTTDTK